MLNNELIDEFIRDVTSVQPLSKSEAREKLQNIITQTRQDTVREVIESYKKGVADMWRIVCREIGDDEGFNKGIGEIDLDKLYISQEKLLNQFREDYNIKDE